MVRHKCRWLLVRLDTQEQLNTVVEKDLDLSLSRSYSRSLSPLALETKHIYHAIRLVIETAFGVTGSAMLTDEFQGRKKQHHSFLFVSIHFCFVSF
jgi:hypothetical protein